MSRRKPKEGDRVTLAFELTGKTPEGHLYRAKPGVGAMVLELREDGLLLLEVGANKGRCLARPTDVERVR